VSQGQNAGESHNIKIHNTSFWKGGAVNIFENNPNKPNSIHEEVKNRLQSLNAGYHSLQNLSSSSLVSHNTKIKVYRTIILPVLYECKTWSLTLRETHKLRLFENRVLRKIFRPKREEIMAVKTP
jgi:hypothetical protein